MYKYMYLYKDIYINVYIYAKTHMQICDIDFKTFKKIDILKCLL